MGTSVSPCLGLLDDGVPRLASEFATEPWDGAERALVVAPLGHAQVRVVVGRQALAQRLGAGAYTCPLVGSA